MEEKDVEKRVPDPLLELSGTALKAYLALLKAGRPVGVRELQRMLGLSSPSTARHHLERLVTLGLAVKLPEGYRAVPPRRGLLTLYLTVRGKLVPRALALASFSVVAAIVYSILPGGDPAATLILATIACLALVDAWNAFRALRSLEEF